MLARAASVLTEVDKRIRALLTLAHVVSAVETPLRVGPAGSKKYLLVACTELFTHYLLGGRDLATFKKMAIADLAAGSVIVHDRYQNYDADPFNPLLHQLCAAHLGRDLEAAVELYPDEVWPTQIAEALRGLIHEANTARDAGADHIDPAVKDKLVRRFRQGVLVGLKATGSHGERPGERKTRLLLEELHARLHGAVFLALKTRGELRMRANRLVRRGGPPVAVLTAGFLSWTVALTEARAAAVALLVGAAAALVAGLLANRAGREGWSFTGTAAAIGLAVAGLFTALFPQLLPSTLDAADSLTTSNASSTPYTLRIMTWVALIFLPLVMGYQAWSYWLFRKRIGVENIPVASGDDRRTD